MLPVYGHDRCPLERDETTSTDPEVIITLSEKPRPRANLDDILVVRRESTFCNTQVAEAPCTTFNSLVPALLQSGTGAPRCDLPLYSLPIRLTVVKIRPGTSPYRRLPRYTTCAPPTLIPCERILPSPPYSHSLFPSGKH
jgi:hypothetical protein